MPVQFTIDVQGATDVHRFLTGYPNKVGLAQVRALNRAINSARTLMVRGIAGDTGLKSRDVRDKLPMREATLNQPSATLAASLKRIPLLDFNARGPEPSRGRGRGVSYRLTGSRGRHPHAFITTVGTGRHRGVFARLGKARTPIVELHGPSLGQVFKKFKAAAEARAQEIFTKNLDHELEFRGGELTDAGGSD